MQLFIFIKNPGSSDEDASDSATSSSSFSVKNIRLLACTASDKVLELCSTNLSEHRKVIRDKLNSKINSDPLVQMITQHTRSQ